MNDRNEAGRYVYHPHVFRVLTLALLKTGGFPPDWTEYYVRHSIGTSSYYVPPTEVLAREWLKVEDKFCFLRPSTYQPQVAGVSNLNADSASARPNMTRPVSITNFTTPATLRWESAAYHFVKTHIEAVDYDQALAVVAHHKLAPNEPQNGFKIRFSEIFNALS